VKPRLPTSGSSAQGSEALAHERRETPNTERTPLNVRSLAQKVDVPRPPVRNEVASRSLIARLAPLRRCRLSQAEPETRGVTLTETNRLVQPTARLLLRVRSQVDARRPLRPRPPDREFHKSTPNPLAPRPRRNDEVIQVRLPPRQRREDAKRHHPNNPPVPLRHVSRRILPNHRRGTRQQPQQPFNNLTIARLPRTNRHLPHSTHARMMATSAYARRLARTRARTEVFGGVPVGHLVDEAAGSR
jgi:hypothetical protein